MTNGSLVPSSNGSLSQVELHLIPTAGAMVFLLKTLQIWLLETTFYNLPILTVVS